MNLNFSDRSEQPSGPVPFAYRSYAALRSALSRPPRPVRRAPFSPGRGEDCRAISAGPNVTGEDTLLSWPGPRYTYSVVCIPGEAYTGPVYIR